MEIDQRTKYQIVGYLAIITSIVTAGAFLYQSTNPLTETNHVYVRTGKVTHFDFQVSELQARQEGKIEFQASGGNFGVRVIEPQEPLDSKDNLDNYEITLVTDKAGLYRITFSNPDVREGRIMGVWKRTIIPELGVGTGGIFLVILLFLPLFSLSVSIYTFYQAKKLKNPGLSENTSGRV